MTPASRTVVFDFDHTLYDGDSGQHLVTWLLRRQRWRTLLALTITPIFAPLIARMPTRRCGLSAFVWVATLGSDTTQFAALIERYLTQRADALRARLLPRALHVLRQHLHAGDRVIIATGAPPTLAQGILALADHGDLPVLGTELGPWLGGLSITRHCHFETKMHMLRDAGYSEIDIAYSDSSADLPLLKAAHHPVVVNPRPARIKRFQRALPEGTPILNWGCPQRAGHPGS